jgi:hypothetical protein
VCAADNNAEPAVIPVAAEAQPLLTVQQNAALIAELAVAQSPAAAAQPTAQTNAHRNQNAYAQPAVNLSTADQADTPTARINAAPNVK